MTIREWDRGREEEMREREPEELELMSDRGMKEKGDK